MTAGLVKLGPDDRYSDGMPIFRRLKVHSIGPAELEQFVYDVTVEVDVDGKEVVLRPTNMKRQHSEAVDRQRGRVRCSAHNYRNSGGALGESAMEEGKAGVELERFEGLPGAVQTNFEMLCRALSAVYGRYGDCRTR